MRVKICGLTRPDDAARAAELGADALGCVLVPGTPRYVGARRAGAVLAAPSRGSAQGVLVFRDAELDPVLRATDLAGVSCVQLHRTPERVALALERRGLSVVRVLSADDWPPRETTTLPANGPGRPLLIDAGSGGTGRTFDWRRLAGLDLRHVSVAGGLRPDNVGRLRRYRPGGIDVSSGVERAPGVKDPELLEQLFAAVHDAAPHTTRPDTPRRTKQETFR